MPGPIETLYGLVVDGDPYHKAAIVLCTNQYSPGETMTFADLREPAVAGYQRHEAQDINDLFRGGDWRPGQSLRLVSHPMEWQNLSTSGVQLTGIALVVWQDPSTPIVAVHVPMRVAWLAGRRLAPRLTITTHIRTQGA